MFWVVGSGRRLVSPRLIFPLAFTQFIVGFRKEQVNANLLNGKGEITNVELNCSFLNEEIRKVSPYIELESVHVSKLSFHVSSWTNVRQSPIVIDIEHVKAVMREALHFTEKCQRAQIRQVTRAELIRLVQSGVVPKPRTTSYNLLDRILDNLTVEIRSVNLTFQPAGKFKTRRPGPWTPPAVRLQLFAVRLVSVNEYGQEASPDEVWRHNHHRRRDGSFLIYKKLETEYQISIVTKKKPSAADPDDNISKNGCAIQEDEDTAPDDHARSSVVDVFDDDDDDELVIPILSSSPKGGGACINNRKKIEIQLALQRRIRDGEYLAIQVDATVPVLDIELAVSTVPHLANFAAAMTYCLAKDRAFTDPLRSTSYVAPNSLLQPLVTAIVDTGSISDEDSSTPIESPGLRSSSLLDLDLEDEASVSSSENEEEADENNEVERSVESDESLEEENGSQSPGSDEGKSAAPVTQPDEKSNAYAGPPSHGTISKPLQTSATTPTSKARSVNNRPLLVLPNGITFHDKISMSVSFHHVTVRGTYAESVDGHIKIIAKGVVAEAIWPKVTMVCQQSLDFVGLTLLTHPDVRFFRIRSFLVNVLL